MNEDMPAIALIKAAILEQIANPAAGHGSFVTAMAEKDYGHAALVADQTNLTFFGHLVKWREFQYLADHPDVK